jgi:hypothetical protein
METLRSTTLYHAMAVNALRVIARGKVVPCNPPLMPLLSAIVDPQIEQSKRQTIQLYERSDGRGEIYQKDNRDGYDENMLSFGSVDMETSKAFGRCHLHIA